MSESGSRYKPAPLPIGGGDPSTQRLVQDALADLPSGESSPLEDQTVISSRGPLSPSGEPAPKFDPAVLREGERLGQFLLLGIVGGGGMGVVFRALDTTLNREVAVKVLARDQSADEETLRRFKNEAQSAARLDHENIARVHYVGEDRGVHYIVFEFIEGVNIRDMVQQRGPLPIDEAINYTFQIAEALSHASQRDVIHRDIKPSNMLVTPDGKAKLVDMGLARLHQVEQAAKDLTESGVTLGTFDYISPEQARDPRNADVRSDLYSLGCSLYFMVTGRPPFPEGTVLQKLLQHQADEPPDPREFRPDLPREVVVILARMLAKNPERRYQTPSLLIDDLVSASDKLGLPRAATSTTVWKTTELSPEPWWRAHVPWLVPLAALVLIVLGLDTYWSSATQVAPEARPPSDKQRIAPASTVVRPPAERQEGKIEPPTISAKAGATSKEKGPPEPVRATTRKSRPGESRNAYGEMWRWLGESIQGNTNLQELADEAVAASLVTSPISPIASLATSGLRMATGRSAVDQAPATKPRDPLPFGARKGVLIVSDHDLPGRTYHSLRAACSEAKNGDAIELHYDGPRKEEPVTCTNVKLTIRAGEGRRPVVLFRPTLTDPLLYSRSMITIFGGQITMTNLHFELDVPRDDAPVDSRTLFDLRGADLLRFENCTMTIRNGTASRAAAHPEIAFIDVQPRPGSGTMTMGYYAQEEKVAAIELQNCVARGEATFLRANELQPVRLDWNNGLLATSEYLLVAGGGATMPRHPRFIQANLRHLTALTLSGFVLLTSTEDAPFQANAEINCADCIISTAGPLVEQRGFNSNESDSVPEFQWNGNHNFYEGLQVFWRVHHGIEGTRPTDLDFRKWQEHWRESERMPVVDEVIWRDVRRTERPFHVQTPSDYALEGGSSNAAVGAAGDGMDVGLTAGELPKLPPQHEATTITPPPSSEASPLR